jgi:hypothetical protein
MQSGMVDEIKRMKLITQALVGIQIGYTDYTARRQSVFLASLPGVRLGTHGVDYIRCRQLMGVLTRNNNVTCFEDTVV